MRAWSETFLPYQREWVFDLSRFSMLLKARQIGASHGYGGAAALWGLMGEATTLVSVGERESTELLEKVAKHAEILHRLGSRWARPSTTATVVRFASGGEVKAVPSTSAGRGRAGNVVLDEAAYYERAEQVWDGAAGSALRGFRIRLASTPNGVGNLFHKMWSDPKASAGYRKFATTIDDAIADGLQVDMAECWKLARGDARVFDQLFRCKFLDNDAQYIPSSLLERCIVEDGEAYQYGAQMFAGLDIGRVADLTVLVVIAVDDEGRRWVQHIETRKRTSQDDIEALAELAFRTFRVRRLCVDATGMGSFPSEALQKHWGRTRVEPVVFTQQVKEDLATTLYQTIADDMLRFERKETRLRDAISAIRRIITSAGNVRYDAPHTEDGHADEAWSLMLALHGCSGPDRRRYVLNDFSG